MTQIFHTPINNASTTVASARSAGSTALTVLDASPFGTPSPSAPLALSVHRSGGPLCILEATGLSGNTFLISGPLDGTTDRDLVVGDSVGCRVTAGCIAELQQAVLSGTTGTVTSVALAMPSGFTVSGSPVTASGTIAVTTSLSGVVKGSSGALVAAVAGTDYVSPGGSYADPAWITSLSGAKVTGNISGNSGGVSVPLPHSGLSGLTTGDDHTQYALLAGRAGGQTLTGGTAASNNLTVQSTSHSTKGYILLGNGGMVGVNQPTPAAQVHVTTATGGTVGQVIQLAASQSSDALQILDSTGVVLVSMNAAGGIVASQTVDSSNVSVNVAQTASVLQSDTTDIGTDYTLSSLVTGFKFTASGSWNARAVGVQLKAVGTITNTIANAAVQIYTDNAGVPGTLVSSGTTTVFGALTSSYVEYQSGYVGGNLTSGSAYWVVITLTALPTGGTIVLNRGSASNTTVATGATIGSVTTTAGASCYYKIYGRTGVGVLASSTNNVGVEGVSNTNQGVYGQSTSGYGVFGQSTSGYGVNGVSLNNYGVSGTSNTNVGVRAVSTTNSGCMGSSTSGVGVFGTSSSGVGLSGTSTSSIGVLGTSTTGVGLFGQQTGTLATNNASNAYTARIFRSLTLAGFDAPASVLRVEDTTASTGLLVEIVKQGVVVASIDKNGSIATGRSSTANRPTVTTAGTQWYDTTLSKPIWWTGSVWKDAAGTTV